MFYKKGVLKKLTKFTGKNLCWSLFFNRFSGLRPATLLKRDSNKGDFLWMLWNLNNFCGLLLVLGKQTGINTILLRYKNFIPFSQHVIWWLTNHKNHYGKTHWKYTIPVLILLFSSRFKDLLGRVEERCRSVFGYLSSI